MAFCSCLTVQIAACHSLYRFFINRLAKASEPASTDVALESGHAPTAIDSTSTPRKLQTLDLRGLLQTLHEDKCDIQIVGKVPRGEGGIIEQHWIIEVQARQQYLILEKDLQSSERGRQLIALWKRKSFTDNTTGGRVGWWLVDWNGQRV